MRSAIGPVLLMLGAFAALEISERTTEINAGSRRGRAGVPNSPEPLDLPGIENAHRLSPSLYSGGKPTLEASFEALAGLGVKTIISVDGANPDASAAQRLGLRTVHLPIGYNGIDLAQSARIVKASRTLPGPFFIHCRHGKHRGPTAAAIVGMALEGWTPEQSLAWLKQAGTSPRYSGLFATLRTFRVPNNAELAVVPDDWPETTEIPPLKKAMIEIDACWEKLIAAPVGKEARLLVDRYRGLAEGGASAGLGDDVQKRLREALENTEALVETLENAPQDSDRGEIERRLERVGRGCKACHEAHRD